MYSNLPQVSNRLIFKSSILSSTRLFFGVTRILVHDLPRVLRIIFMSWFFDFKINFTSRLLFSLRKVAIARLAMAYKEMQLSLPEIGKSANQPASSFNFPKRSFGKTKVVYRAFQ